MWKLWSNATRGKHLSRTLYSASSGRRNVDWYGHSGNNFQEVPLKDLLSLCDQGRLREAIICLSEKGARPDPDTYCRLLTLCAKLKALAEGRTIHELTKKTGLIRDTFVGNRLVDMYGKCGSVEEAKQVFETMSNRGVIAWTSMIAAYCQDGKYKEARVLLKRMEFEGVKPDKVTYIAILNAFVNGDDLEQARIIHKHIIQRGFESDVVVGNALVSMYGRCKSLEEAHIMFEKMPNRNVVTWTTLITSYAEAGLEKDAFQFYKRMHLENIAPNRVTLIAILEACSSLGFLPEGKVIHACIVNSNIMLDSCVGNTVLNMYSKCSSIKDARDLFDSMPEKDLVSWTIMIAAYVHHDCCTKALRLFRKMEYLGILPNKITYLSVLDACANLAALEEGQLFHDKLIEHGWDRDILLGSALIDMYAKCGDVEAAHKTFQKINDPNVCTWTAIISAYAQLGKAHDSLTLFQAMYLGGVLPDDITFISLLSACCHAGFVTETFHYLISMCGDYSITPRPEHYGCAVNAMGHGGQLDAANDFIFHIHVEPNVPPSLRVIEKIQEEIVAEELTGIME